MNTARWICKFLTQDKCRTFGQLRNFSTTSVLERVPRKGKTPDYYPKDDGTNLTLWYSSLPGKRKRAISMAERKKAKMKKGKIPCGPVLIECKNKKLNHCKGIQYGKFDVVPLASKGWRHRKSAGDYFTILPTNMHPAFLIPASETSVSDFASIGVRKEIIEELNKLEITSPTSIQAKSINKIMDGNSVMITAETGCGKTLAYLIPMLQNIMDWKKKVPEKLNSPFAVIILPTRELAVQVGVVANSLASNLGIKCLTFLGGNSKGLLTNPNVDVVDILVITPGILRKFAQHKIFTFENCKQVVLDEADTLLDDTFSHVFKSFLTITKLQFREPSLINIYQNTAQLCLVSATMPTSARTILENVVVYDNLEHISTVFLHKIQPHVQQLFLRISRPEKPFQLLKLVRNYLKQSLPTMIFCNKSKTSNWLSLFLNENGVKSIRINASMGQRERLLQYQSFRDGMYDVITCTDIASRGLDCPRIKRVINYDFPEFMADYIHRCGRTARIGHITGCEIVNLISSAKEVQLVWEIEKAARMSGKLPNVNNNISRIIESKELKRLEARS